MNRLGFYIKELDPDTLVGLGKIVIGFVLSIIASVVLLVAAWHLGGTRAVNVLVVVFGGVGGWIIGILISPKTEIEAVQFSEYGKAISAFVSGFLLAKIDVLFNTAVTTEGAAFTDLFLGRLLLFGSAFGLGALATFIGRRYVTLAKSPN